MTAAAQVTPAATGRQRLRALDAARGLAVLGMFVAHGYDGWVRVEHKASFGYRITRELAAVAMPSFVLLAGIGLGLRMASVAGAGRAAVGAARRAVIARGLRLLLGGYALSFAYAALDGGWVAATLLRADALHAIGACLAVVAALLPWAGHDAHRATEPDAARAQGRRLTRAALGCALLLWLATPFVTQALHALRGPLAYPLAVLVHVEGVTRFSLLPLGALCAFGVALAPAAPRLGSTRAALALAALGGGGAGVFASATAAVLHATGGVLSTAHVAVLPNALDGLCRAACALGLGALAVLHAPRLLARALAALGRRSLALYALHVPLCYGRLSTPLHGRLDLLAATWAVALLSVVAATLAMALERRPSAR